MTADEITTFLTAAEAIRISTEHYEGDLRFAKYRTVAVANHFLNGNQIDIAAFNLRCDPALTESDMAGVQGEIDNIIAMLEPPDEPVVEKMRLNASPSTGEFFKVEQSLSAIVNVYNNPHPRVFVRGGKLSRVICNEDGFPAIEAIDEKTLSYITSRCIEWFAVRNVIDKTTIPHTVTQEEYVTVTPKLVLPRLFAWGEWQGIPPLLGVVECPYITTDGTIVTEPGYNPCSRLYLARPDGVQDICVPDAPTPEDIAAAKTLLVDLFSDFGFEDQASRENHIACLITVAIRPTIRGLIPMFVYDKPVQGAGASLLAKLITQITTGRPPTMTDSPKKASEEEWNKLIIGLLREGRALNIFDNVEGDMYSSALASVLTAEYYGGRLLGKNETVRYPNRSVWIANGNNIQITHDLPRRCVWIRLTTDTARPYERTGWKYPDILEYVREHQTEYLSAILTIVKGWYAAGKPPASKTLQVMGGFEEWRDMLGGIMKFIGCDEFLNNTSANLEVAEEAHEEVETFLEYLFYAFRGDQSAVMNGVQTTTSFTVKDIIPLADPNQISPGTGRVPVHSLPAKIQGVFRDHPEKVSHTIGNVLKQYNGRVFQSGYKINRGGMCRNVASYRISFRKPVQKITDNHKWGA